MEQVGARGEIAVMDLNGHVSTCPKCYAPSGRFCDEGKRLRIEHDAEFFAADLVKFTTGREQEAYMEKFCKNYFDMPALRKTIKAKIQEIKQRQKATA